jgi:hypothetical protein
MSWNERKHAYLAAKLSEIIDRSRRITGHAALSEDDLIKAAEAWTDVLEGYQPEACERAYRALMRERDDRAPVQPVELLAFLRESRLRTPRPPLPADQADTVSCRHCDGVGYQIVLQQKYGREYTSARGCVCAACPQSQRSQAPLGPPDYERDARGYWHRTPSPFACDPEAA